MFYSKLPGSRKKKPSFHPLPKANHFTVRAKSTLGPFWEITRISNWCKSKLGRSAGLRMGARQMMNKVWRFHLEPSCHLKARLLSPPFWWADSARNIRRLTAEKPSKWRSGTATALLCRWEKEKTTALHQGPIPLSPPLAKNCFLCWFSTKKY